MKFLHSGGLSAQPAPLAVWEPSGEVQLMALFLASGWAVLPCRSALTTSGQLLHWVSALWLLVHVIVIGHSNHSVNFHISLLCLQDWVETCSPISPEESWIARGCTSAWLGKDAGGWPAVKGPQEGSRACSSLVSVLIGWTPAAS